MAQLQVDGQLARCDMLGIGHCRHQGDGIEKRMGSNDIDRDAMGAMGKSRDVMASAGVHSGLDSTVLPFYSKHAKQQSTYLLQSAQPITRGPSTHHLLVMDSAQDRKARLKALRQAAELAGGGEEGGQDAAPEAEPTQEPVLKFRNYAVKDEQKIQFTKARCAAGAEESSAAEPGAAVPLMQGGAGGGAGRHHWRAWHTHAHIAQGAMYLAAPLQVEAVQPPEFQPVEVDPEAVLGGETEVRSGRAGGRRPGRTAGGQRLCSTEEGLCRTAQGTGVQLPQKRKLWLAWVAVGVAVPPPLPRRYAAATNLRGCAPWPHHIAGGADQCGTQEGQLGPAARHRGQASKAGAADAGVAVRRSDMLFSAAACSCRPDTLHATERSLAT